MANTYRLETLETLPDDCYTGLIGDYVATMAPTTEAPPEYHFGAFAVTLGLVFADVSLEEGTHKYHPTIFGILVGPTGLGRKTTVTNAAEKMLYRIDPNIPVVTAEGSRQGMMSRLIDYGNVRAALALDASAFGNGNGKSRRAAVAVPVLLTSREFTKLLRQSSRTATGDLTEFYLELFDRPKMLENNSQASPMTILAPVAAMLGDSTEEALADLFTQINVSNGFLNRLSLFRAEYTGDPLPRPDGPDEEQLENIAKQVRDLRFNIPKDAKMTFSDAGGAAFDRLYVRTLVPRMKSGNGEAIAREEGQVKRFALLYALQDARLIIEPEDVERGWQVARYLSTSALSLAGKVGAGDKAKALAYILKRIEAAGIEGIQVGTGKGVGYLSDRLSTTYRPLVRSFGLANLVKQLLEDGDALVLTPAHLLSLGVTSQTDRYVARNVAREAQEAMGAAE